MNSFDLVSDFSPQGDQPEAIRQLTDGIRRRDKFQTLLGVTGSGKTFSMAHVIAAVNKPTLIISHNKTLAAQLFGEFKGFFPNNCVEFFISYYDYYQPEAYIATTDTYIEKDTSINEDIDRLRLRATSSLLSRKDVIIVASVSCIYGLGSPEDFEAQLIFLEKGQHIPRNILLEKLVDIHYSRNDIDFSRSTFRVRGDVVEVIPADAEEAFRIEMFGDEIERLSQINTVTGEIIREQNNVVIYPAKHHVTTYQKLTRAMGTIQEELDDRLKYFRDNNMLLEAQRIETRTNYDLEMMQEIGFCSGIENYSRHLSGRKAGERPFTLLDYFPDDFLMMIDESHVSIPQVRGMYHGDRARKEMLVRHGFRLPSALDNRPLNFEEFESMLNQVVFVSATPADYELEKSDGVVVEQIIRPTGLLDPEILIRPIKGQIDDLIHEIRLRVERNERVLVTTLTKRMSEDLTDYLTGVDIRVRYLHSEIDALERVEILRSLRLAEFDVLVGINLLREGLDLPEVSLVAILDADKEGFLRSERSLIQTAGRAARNSESIVIFYADKITRSMQVALDVTERRRKIQDEYNQKHNITPQTIRKSVDEVMGATLVADTKGDKYNAKKQSTYGDNWKNFSPLERADILERLEKEMMDAAKQLDFEKATVLRDEITLLKQKRSRYKRADSK